MNYYVNANCEVCGSNKCVSIETINGNIYDLTKENLIAICQSCYKKYKKNMMVLKNKELRPYRP